MIEELSTFLRQLPTGRVPKDKLAELEDRLAPAWDEFKIPTEGGMEGYKLRSRMEDVEWSPPILRFTIERHGAAALGSSRAAL